jgi:hypothetical protein
MEKPKEEFNSKKKRKKKEETGVTGNIRNGLVNKKLINLIDDIVSSTIPEINTGVYKLDPRGSRTIFCRMDQAQNSGSDSLTVSQVIRLYVMMWDKMRAVKEEALNMLGRKPVTLGMYAVLKKKEVVSKRTIVRWTRPVCERYRYLNMFEKIERVVETIHLIRIGCLAWSKTGCDHMQGNFYDGAGIRRKRVNKKVVEIEGTSDMEQSVPVNPILKSEPDSIPAKRV